MTVSLEELTTSKALGSVRPLSDVGPKWGWGCGCLFSGRAKSLQEHSVKLHKKAKRTPEQLLGGLQASLTLHKVKCSVFPTLVLLSGLLKKTFWRAQPPTKSLEEAGLPSGMQVGLSVVGGTWLTQNPHNLPSGGTSGRTLVRLSGRSTSGRGNQVAVQTYGRDGEIHGFGNRPARSPR